MRNLGYLCYGLNVIHWECQFYLTLELNQSWKILECLQGIRLDSFNLERPYFFLLTILTHSLSISLNIKFVYGGYVQRTWPETEHAMKRPSLTYSPNTVYPIFWKQTIRDGMGIYMGFVMKSREEDWQRKSLRLKTLWNIVILNTTRKS